MILNCVQWERGAEKNNSYFKMFVFVVFAFWLFSNKHGLGACRRPENRDADSNSPEFKLVSLNPLWLVTSREGKE